MCSAGRRGCPPARSARAAAACAPPASSPRFSRSSGRDVLHPEPLVDLLLGGAGRGARSASSATRTRSRAAPAAPPAVRSASLCLPEPVKCWSRFPNASSGTIRRSTGDAGVRHGPRARRRRRTAPRRSRGSAEKARRQRPASSAVAPRGRGPCRSSAMRRALPASSTRVRRGGRAAPPPARPPTASAWDRMCRGRAAVAPAASAARTFSSALAPKPGTSRSAARPRRPRCSSSSESTPSVSYSWRARFGPRPGRRVISTRPAGNFAFSLSAAGIEPRLEQRVDLLGDRLADARQLAALPGVRELLHRGARLADRLRRVAVGERPGRPPRRRARTGRQLVECRCYLGVPHARRL